MTIHLDGEHECLADECGCDAARLAESPTVYRNAEGRVLDMTFNVDDEVLVAIEEGRGFYTLRAAKESDRRAWVSPEVSFKLLCGLEDRVVEIERALASVGRQADEVVTLVEKLKEESDG